MTTLPTLTPTTNQLEGELQAKYGYAKDKAKQEVDH